MPRGRRRSTDEARLWAEMYRSGTPVVKIAAQVGADPGTVSKMLHRVGVELHQGSHRVKQPRLRLSPQLVELVSEGPERVTEVLVAKVWGIQFSPHGVGQVEKFCKFVQMHTQGVGVEETSTVLSVHRSTVAKWRNGTDLPYLIKTVDHVSTLTAPEGWKFVPCHVGSGGNETEGWAQVPTEIRSYGDIVRLVERLSPNEEASDRAKSFELTSGKLEELKAELFAYLLGALLGDLGKGGGPSTRFASCNLDLQLTKKKESNERFGEFVCFCANLLGLSMSRHKDKQPTGATLRGKDPSASFRWVSERSPLIAWMLSVCMGLKWSERTSYDSVRMDWIFSTPFEFRKRFAQGIADSDGSVDEYLVRIVSVPNSLFLAKVLQSLGLKTATVMNEDGRPLRTKVSTTEAAKLPIFSEFVRSYRYDRLVSLRSD